MAIRFLSNESIDGSITVGDDVIVSGNITLVNKTTSEVGSILLGSGNALQIFYDGSNSFVSDSGTGDLYVRSNSTLILKSATTKIQAFGSSVDFVTINSTGATFAENVFARRGSFGTASNFNFDLYVNGNAYINDALTVDDNATFAGTISSGAITASGSTAAGVLTLESTSASDLTITTTAANTWEFSNAGNNSVYNAYSHTFKNASTTGLTIDSSGNVGVGGTKANKKLYVLGDTTNYQILAEQPSGYAGLSIKSTTLAQTWSWIANDNGSNSDLLLYGGAAAGVKLTIDSSGNVGIGTTSPQAKLHIDPTTTDEIAIAINGTQNYSAGEFQRISAGDTGSLNRLSIGFGYDDPTDWAIRYSSYGRHEFYTGNDWGNAANTEKMVITSAGNVGIGTDAPDGKLSIYSTATYDPRSSGINIHRPGSFGQRGSLAYDGDEFQFSSTYSGNGATNWGTFRFQQFNNGTTARTAMFINTAGNVGIGTTSPSNALTIYGSSTGGFLYPSIKGITKIGVTDYTLFLMEQYGGNEGFLGLYFDNIKKIQLRSNGDSYFNGGNVGIGTTSPGAKLDVRGSGGYLKFDSSGSDGTIKSDYNLKLYADDTGDNSSGFANMQFFTAGANERMRITSGGVVQVATVPGITPAILTARKNGTCIEFGHGNNTGRYEGTLGVFGSSGNSYIGFATSCDNSANTFTTRGGIGNVIDGDNSGNLNFQQATNANASGQTLTQRMRISNVGRVTINTTIVTDARCTIAGDSSHYALNLYADVLYSSVYRYQRFRSGGNIAGGIEGSNQTSVVYNTSSDYRMKKNIKPLENGLERLSKLKPVKFDWKLNDESTEGFIAHEVQEIFPDAISGEKDGEDMQGMDYGRITPLLVAAIQELKAEIEILKNK